MYQKISVALHKCGIAATFDRDLVFCATQSGIRDMEVVFVLGLLNLWDPHKPTIWTHTTP